MQRILVGIDDSENARRALRWALDHAGPDDEITALHVWTIPPVSGFDAAFLDPAVFEEGARVTAAAVVDDVVDNGERSRLSVETPCGHASETLIERGRDADLIVIGTRGHGGFAGLVLGSITTNVVNHAPCPVVVVPAGSAD